MLEDRYAEALPAGYRLGSYRIESVLGQGGFGITYRAFDTREQKVVAIKEFFPSRSAARETGNRVCPSSGSAVDDFSYGLRRFISEAETLTQFNHPSIVKVSRLMTANDTAYMVMSYEEGESLASLLDRSPKGLEDQEIVRLLAGIVDGLDLVHRTEHLHRDIAPDNIIIRRDRTPVLIDFGAVRYLCSQKSGSTAAIIKRGYSPPEQYASVTDRQGPWTDIYALGAVAYRCIGGLKLPNSMDRQHSVAETGVDPLIPAATLGKGRYSPALLHAIDRALALKCSDRPQSAKQWLAMFSPPAPPPTEAQREARPPRPSSLRRLWDSVFSTRQRRDKGSAPAAPAASIGGLPSTAAGPARRR